MLITENDGHNTISYSYIYVTSMVSVSMAKFLIHSIYTIIRMYGSGFWFSLRIGLKDFSSACMQKNASIWSAFKVIELKCMRVTAWIWLITRPHSQSAINDCVIQMHIDFRASRDARSRSPNHENQKTKRYSLSAPMKRQPDSPIDLPGHLEISLWCENTYL